VITTLAGSPATGAGLGWLLATGKVGDVVPVEFSRAGAVRQTEITLAEQPAG
jgi:hypothetical protein